MSNTKRENSVAALADAFGQLRPIEQRVVWLTLVEHRAASAAAELLEISPAELGRIAFRARDHLRLRFAAASSAVAAPRCRPFVDGLTTYALGAAGHEAQVRTYRHVAGCVQCHRTLNILNDLAAGLRAARLAAPAGLIRELSAVTPIAGRRTVRSRSRSYATVAVAVSVLGFTGVAGALHGARSVRSTDYAISDPFLAPGYRGVDVTIGALPARPATPARPVPETTLVVVDAAPTPVASASVATPAPVAPASVGEGAPEPVPAPAPIAPEAPPTVVVGDVVEAVGALADDTSHLLSDLLGGLLGDEASQ